MGIQCRHVDLGRIDAVETKPLNDLAVDNRATPVADKMQFRLQQLVAKLLVQIVQAGEQCVGGSFGESGVVNVRFFQPIGQQNDRCPWSRRLISLLARPTSCRRAQWCPPGCTSSRYRQPVRRSAWLVQGITPHLHSDSFLEDPPTEPTRYPARHRIRIRDLMIVTLGKPVPENAWPVSKVADLRKTSPPWRSRFDAPVVGLERR